MLDRFWSKVEIKSVDECWEYKGQKRRYPNFWISTPNKKGINITAHRFSWIISNKKDIPEDKVVMHKCDNTHCVNPSHLKLGSTFDNVQDKISKGRAKYTGAYTHPDRKGEKHPLSILKDDDVIKIIKLLKEGKKAEEIAELFKVNKNTVHSIRQGSSWKHLGTENLGKLPRPSAAKLTEDQVREIKKLLREEIPQREIAKRYGVGKSTIGAINKGISWKEIE